MKKKLKKILVAFLVAIVSYCTLTTSVYAVPQSIELGGTEQVPGYIAGTYFTTKTTIDGDLMYCLNIHKYTAQNTTAHLVGELDAGVAYIMLNGYPNKTFTGERLKDYYITQTALWWYLDDTTGSSNLSVSFKTDGSDQYNLRPYIQDLVAKAKVAKEQGYQSSSISATISNNALSMSSDSSYYVSDEITVSSTNVDEYNVEIAEGPSNTVAIDSNGTAKTTFAANETFRVQVPVSDVDDSLVNIKVNISATGKVYKAYEYQPENDNQQNVTPSVISPVEENVNTSIDLTISTSKVTIVKIDQSTGQPLAGAVIVIKDADGNEVARFTSTTDPYVLTGLKDGTYTVEEVQAPEGYQKSNKVISFTLDSENVSQQITIENYPEISVPNTNTASSILLVILGLGIIGGGIKFVQKKSRI